MQQTQTPLLDLLIDDGRPVHEWAGGVVLLGREVYAKDAGLARDFERAVERLVWLRGLV